MASLHLPETNLTRAEIPYCGASAMVQTTQNTIPQDPLEFGKKLSIIIQRKLWRRSVVVLLCTSLFFDGICR